MPRLRPDTGAACSVRFCRRTSSRDGAQPVGAAQPPPDPAVVERQLLEAVQRAPDSFVARHRLAGFYLQQGKVPAAIPHLQRAQQIDPSQYAVGYDLAVALIEINRLDDARVQVRRLLTLKDVGEVHNLLGDLEERAGNLVAAAEAYQRASHMDPSEENLFDWGNSLLQLRASGAGRRGVRVPAIKRHPRSARLHVGLGISLYSRGEYKDAVQSFCDAVDLAPSDPRPYQFLGEVYGVAPELGGEISARLRKFVAAYPKNALAHFHYAMSLWKGGGRGARRATTCGEIEALLETRGGARPTQLTKGILRAGCAAGRAAAHMPKRSNSCAGRRRCSRRWRRRTIDSGSSISASVATISLRRSWRSFVS